MSIKMRRLNFITCCRWATVAFAKRAGSKLLSWFDELSCTVELSSLFDSCIGFTYRIRVYLALRMQFSNSDSRSVPHRLNFFTHAKVRHFRIYNSATVGDVTCLPTKHETSDCFHFELSQLSEGEKKSKNWWNWSWKMLKNWRTPRTPRLPRPDIAQRTQDTPTLADTMSEAS